MTRSSDLFAQAQKLMPGGVSSPVRAFRSVNAEPLFMAAGEGAYLIDVDGQRYLDFCGSWGPLILGHRHPKVQRAMQDVLDRGWAFGTPVPAEVDLAGILIEHVPALEMMRFVNSGTEAVMSAVRLARGVTKRSAVLKFNGCYHGHADYLLVKGGSGLATMGQPSSLGVPPEFAKLTHSLPLDEPATLKEFFRHHGDTLACALVEGVPANNGLLIQDPSWMHLLQNLCREAGCLLIVDEVLTGFRMPDITATRHYGLQPDLITLGKVVGGGMPVGAYGGRAELMAHIAPLGGVYQAGTLAGNPLAMAAGYATLEVFFEEKTNHALEELGRFLDAQLQPIVSDCANLGYVRLGSLFWFFFHCAHAPQKAEDIPQKSAETYAELHRFMLHCGIYLAPSAFEVGFLNAAMTKDDLCRLAETLRGAKEKGIVT